MHWPPRPVTGLASRSHYRHRRGPRAFRLRLRSASGFARLTAAIALSHVGLVLGLEASRLARNNADWHRLIDLGGLTDTLIGDADGIYHPALLITGSWLVSRVP